jgi:hypothetical protein
MYAKLQKQETEDFRSHPCCARMGNRQVLREADPSLTTPRLKKTSGAPCAQDDSSWVRTMFVRSG